MAGAVKLSALLTLILTLIYGGCAPYWLSRQGVLRYSGASPNPSPSPSKELYLTFAVLVVAGRSAEILSFSSCSDRLCEPANLRTPTTNQ